MFEMLQTGRDSRTCTGITAKAMFSSWGTLRTVDCILSKIPLGLRIPAHPWRLACGISGLSGSISSWSSLAILAIHQNCALGIMPRPVIPWLFCSAAFLELSASLALKCSSSPYLWVMFWCYQWSCNDLNSIKIKYKLEVFNWSVQSHWKTSKKINSKFYLPIPGYLESVPLVPGCCVAGAFWPYIPGNWWPSCSIIRFLREDFPSAAYLLCSLSFRNFSRGSIPIQSFFRRPCLLPAADDCYTFWKI